MHGQFGPDMVVLGRDGPRVVHFSTTPPYGAATPAADILAWAQVVGFAAAGHRPATAGGTWRRSLMTCARWWPTA